MVDIDNLKKEMRKKGWSIEKLSRLLGIDRSTLYRRLLEDGSKITIKDATIIATILNLSKKQVDNIFFKKDVAQNAKTHSA